MFFATNISITNIHLTHNIFYIKAILDFEMIKGLHIQQGVLFNMFSKNHRLCESLFINRYSFSFNKVSFS